MINFKTTINALYTLQSSSPDYVCNVLFTVTGTNGDRTSSLGGSVQFSSLDAPESFVPFANLTQAIVLNWIEASGKLPDMQKFVQSQIENIIEQPVTPKSKPLPWAVA